MAIDPSARWGKWPTFVSTGAVVATVFLLGDRSTALAQHHALSTAGTAPPAARRLIRPTLGILKMRVRRPVLNRTTRSGAWRSQHRTNH